MFKKTMDYIKDFLDNTPDDIYDFSCDLEGLLIVRYDEMHTEQPRATEILNDETPDICATGEFKRKLRIEYEKALKAVK